MMSYQNPPSVDENETAVHVVTTITPPTTTTSIHNRSLKWMIVIVAGMMLVTGGVVLMQDGSSYYHSSGSLKTEDGSITTATEGLVVGTQGQKTAMTTTTTPTLKTLIAEYPELNDSSPEEQDFQYQAYLLYLTGMTLEELDAYFNINNDVGQQDGGGADAPRKKFFPCCKDLGTSLGCVSTPGPPTGNPLDTCRGPPITLLGCVRAGSTCCRIFPDSRVGSKFWFWESCT